MPAELRCFDPSTYTVTDEFLPTNPSMALPAEERALKLQYTTLYRDATAFLMQRGSGKVAADQTFPRERRVAFEQVWRDNFVRLNAVIGGSGLTQRSFTNVGFIGICAARLAESPQVHKLLDRAWVAQPHWKRLKKRELKEDEKQVVETLLPLTRLWDVFLFVAVFSCTHDAVARTMWPTPQELEAFRDDVALCVHCFFGRSPSVLSFTQQLIEGSTLAPAEEKEHPLWKHFCAFRLPQGLKDAMQVRRDKAEEKRARQSEEVRNAMREVAEPGEEEDDDDFDPDELGETAEEMEGFLWRSSSHEFVSAFLVKAERFLFKVDSDEAFLAHYRAHEQESAEPMEFSRATHDRLDAWLKRKCTGEQAEELTSLFRELAMTWFFPLGTETATSRDALTKDLKIVSQLQLQAQLGADLTAFLYEQTLQIKPLKLIQRPDYADALLLAQWEFEARQLARLEWVETYVCFDPHDAAWCARFESPTFLNDVHKCPVIVLARKCWWLLYRDRLIAVRSFRHALLQWLFVVKRDRANGHRVPLEDGTDFARCIALWDPEPV